MASIILFHSMLGLRDLERDAAARLRQAGHDVVLPDLYDGAWTDDLAEGAAMKATIGWDGIRDRAAGALAGFPMDCLLGGISMGAGVVGEFWPSRPDAAGVMLLHGLCAIPDRRHLRARVQVNLSASDPFFPLSEVHAWRTKAKDADLAADVVIHTQPGHLLMDENSKDYTKDGAALIWQNIHRFIGQVSTD